MSNNKSLIIAIIVLGIIAVAAVASSVTLWITGSSSNGGPVTNQPAPAAANNPSVPVGRNEAVLPDKPVSVSATPVPAESTGVFINEKELTPAQMDGMRKTYGAAPPAGRYWYDSRSGLYGYWGFEAAGYIRPGHDFGTVSAKASRGNTGVFLNGREINLTEALFFQRLFGVVYQGHFWLDGATGNLGIEGNPVPMANLVAAMQQAQRSNSSSEYHWRDGSGAVVSSDGNCTFAAIPGAPVYSNPGC